MAQEYSLSDPNLYAIFESQYGLPEGILYAQAKQESAFNPKARSPVGAKGLMQFMDGTAKQYGVDVNDPVQSIEGAARMMSDLLNKYSGDTTKALAGYNWGQGNVDRKGVERLPMETSKYIASIEKTLADLRAKKQVANAQNGGGNAQIQGGQPSNMVGVTSENATPTPQEQPASNQESAVRQAMRDYLSKVPPEQLDSVVQEIDDLDDAELEQFKSGLLMKSQPQNASSETPPQQEQPVKNTQDTGYGLGSRVADTLSMGFMDEAVAYPSAGIKKLFGDERPYGDIVQESLDRQRGAARQYEEQNPWSATGADLTAAALTLPKTAAGAGVQAFGKYGLPTLKTLGQATGISTLLGGIGGFGAGEGDFENRLQSGQSGAVQGGLLGAGLTTAVPVAAKGIGTLGTKLNNAGAFDPVKNLYAAAKDKFTGGTTPKVQTRNYSPQGQEAMQTEQLASELGYNPLTYSEAVGRMEAPTASKFETALENVPFLGINKQRIAGQRQVQDVVTGLADKEKTKMLDAVGTAKYDDLQRFASGEMGAKRQKEAQNVLKMIDSAGDNFKDVIQASGNVSLLRRKITADRIYDRAKTIGDEFAIQPKNLFETYDNLISAKNSELIKDEGLIKTLDGLRKATQDSNGYSDLASLHKARDFIQEARYNPPPSVIQSQYEVGLGRIEDAINKDIDNLLKRPVRKQDIQNLENPFIKRNEFETMRSKADDAALKAFNKRYGRALGGESLTSKQNEALAETRRSWNAAENYYKTKVVDFKDRMLSDALTRKDTDTIYDLLFNRGMDKAGDNTKRITRIFNSLDETGRSAARYGFMNQGVLKALDDKTGMLSPLKFASYLDQNKAKADVFFKGKERDLLEGHKKVLARLERLGQYAENPPTGNRLAGIGERALAGYGGGAAAIFTVGGATSLAASIATGAGASSLTKFLLTSPKGKQFLYASSKLKDGDPKLDKIIEQIGKFLPRYVGQQSGQAQKPKYKTSEDYFNRQEQ